MLQKLKLAFHRSQPNKLASCSHDDIAGITTTSPDRVNSWFSSQSISSTSLAEASVRTGTAKRGKTLWLPSFVRKPTTVTTKKTDQNQNTTIAPSLRNHKEISFKRETGETVNFVDNENIFQAPLQPVKIKKTVHQAPSSSKLTREESAAFNPRLGDMILDSAASKPLILKDSELTLATSSMGNFGSFLSSQKSLSHFMKMSQASLGNLFTPKPRGKVSPVIERRFTLQSTSALPPPIPSKDIPQRLSSTTNNILDDKASTMTIRTGRLIPRRHTVDSTPRSDESFEKAVKKVPRRATVGLRYDETLKRLQEEAEIQERIQQSHQRRLENQEFVESVVRPRALKPRHLSNPVRTQHPLSKTASSPSDLFELEYQMDLERDSRRVRRRQERSRTADPVIESSPPNENNYTLGGLFSFLWWQNDSRAVTRSRSKSSMEHLGSSARNKEASAAHPDAPFELRTIKQLV